MFGHQRRVKGRLRQRAEAGCNRAGEVRDGISGKVAIGDVEIVEPDQAMRIRLQTSHP
ncbi:hypothetical protein [Xanthomonas vasicola]|uniref:hypothetical protein n=1 Tax=Xanthomonas vasicola TaxID=56459 RepID=UPI000A4D760B|nr:hypothetical protein [Xanthomonas vasicola]MDO6986776.1 hypothetical protein [Xanthomonas vasicola]